MNSTHILIVDDEPGYAELLASRLSRTGWRILVATSGEDALQILQQEDVDVLASDYLMLDGMDGAALVNAAIAFRPDLYSIIFTGWKEREFAVQALRAGVSEFLDKTDRLDDELERAVRRGIQMVTLARFGHELLELDDEKKIFDLLIKVLARLGRFDGCCLAVLTQQDVWRIERAIDLRTGKDLAPVDLDLAADSAYRYVIDHQTVYLPPVFAPSEHILAPYFPTSQSIAAVPLLLKGERGALGIEHEEPNRFGVEDIRFLNHVAKWISLALERLLQQQERVRLEKEIGADTKDRLARAALHEIKNPLNNVATLVQVAADDLPSEVRHSLLDNVTRINNALNRHFKGLIRGEETPRENINVAQLVQDAAARFRHYPLPDSLQISEQVSPALPTIVGHRSLLVSAIVNLLDNAAIAAAENENPTIKIHADYAAGRDQVEILITDNGPGIADANISRIFDYSFTTREASGHTGYGLAFVKDVVELSGGRVSVETAESRGATFKLSFPSGALEPTDDRETVSRKVNA